VMPEKNLIFCWYAEPFSEEARTDAGGVLI
jgi:hypothetical protein